MAKNGGRAKETAVSVIKLKGAVEDNVIYRALMILADVHVLHFQWIEAEEMLSGLLRTSNLRASHS